MVAKKSSPATRAPRVRDRRASRFELHGEKFVVLSVAARRPDTAELAVLSRAEREVLKLVLAGRSNADIAKRRATALRTVANQIASIFTKLGVRSRTELASRFG
jgi:DNA-binding NarL/FixJ family response regulator